jgi:hypothetical protein
MRDVFYYENGEPKILRLDDDHNMLYIGVASYENATIHLNAEKLPTEILNPETIFEDTSATELQSLIQKDFKLMVAKLGVNKLSPEIVFRMLHGYVCRYQTMLLVERIMSGAPKKPRVDTSPVNVESVTSQDAAEDEVERLLLHQKYRDAVFHDKPCAKSWEGCVSLRNALKKELANLPDNCTMCERGGVTSKYDKIIAKRVEELLKK